MTDFSDFDANNIHAAVMAGMAMTNPDDESCRVSMRHAAGAIVLRELLARVLRGELVFATPREQETGPEMPQMRDMQEDHRAE